MRDAFAKWKDNPVYRARYPQFATLNPATDGPMGGNKFVRNILCYRDPKAKLYSLGNYLPDKNECDYNLIWNFGAPLQVGLSAVPGEAQWAEWQKSGCDRHSMLADPLFVNAEKDDYRLKPESPAFTLGFKAIPVERIGPYKDRLRASWPIREAEGVRERPLVCDKPEKPPTPNPRKTTPFAVKTAKAPALDGVQGAGEWPGPEMAMKETPGRIPIKGRPCAAKVCYNNEYLCVALTVPLNAPAKLDRSEQWAKGDCAEVCFQDVSGEKGGPIFVVHGYVTGKCESVTLGGAPADAVARVGAGVRFAAKADGKQWTGEWAIPFAAAGIAPRPGLKLAFNVAVHRAENSEWICWVGTMGSAYDLGSAGYLILE